jgi:Leucine-rich repeat (LRR) protein
VLIADDNFISMLPIAELLNHSAFLQKLSLANNLVCNLPEDCFRELQLLKSVVLASNKLTRLPDSLFSLHHLTHLDVSNNLIETL